MGRQRQRTINTQTWEPALQGINRMERAMVNVTAKAGEVTHDDVLDWMVPAEYLKLLREAFPHANITSSSSYDSYLEFNTNNNKITLHMEWVHMKCLPPMRKLIAVQENAPRHGAIMERLNKIAGIVEQHDKLRMILAHFKGKNVTPGAARHYFPTLQSLLPNDHAYFQVKGDRFKDVHFDYSVTEYLREAPEIIARGLLCNPNVNGLSMGGVRTLIRLNVGDIGQPFSLYAQKTP